MLGLVVSGIGCLLLLVLAREPIAGWLGDPALASSLPALGLFLLLMLGSAVLEIALVARKGYGLASFAYSASDLLRAGFLVLATLATASLGGLLAGAVAFAA